MTLEYLVVPKSKEMLKKQNKKMGHNKRIQGNILDASQIGDDLSHKINDSYRL